MPERDVCEYSTKVTSVKALMDHHWFKEPATAPIPPERLSASVQAPPAAVANSGASGSIEVIFKSESPDSPPPIPQIAVTRATPVPGRSSSSSSAEIIPSSGRSRGNSSGHDEAIQALPQTEGERSNVRLPGTWPPTQSSKERVTGHSSSSPSAPQPRTRSRRHHKSA